MLSSKYWIGVLLLGIMYMGWCQEPARQPHKYLIPTGYVGWIRVNFNIKDAKPLQLEDGFLIFKIPHTGLLNTSSTSQIGWATDEYYLYDGDTLQKIDDPRKYIWGAFTGKEAVSGEGPSFYEYFFVGDEKDYQKHAKSNNSRLPNIGPIHKD